MHTEAAEVRLTDNHEKRDTREGCTPSDIASNIFDSPDASRRASQYEKLDIVDDEGDNLKESSGRSGQTL